MATVLIIGDGGPEHALARSLADDADVDRVICAPGNAGTEALKNVDNFPHADSNEIVGLAAREAVDLVVIGPEQSLIDGVADGLRKRGLRVLGLGHHAAELAGSKVHAKGFMGRYGLPTPAFRVFNHPRPALRHLDAMWAEAPDQTFVIKADEPCGGQGTYSVQTPQQAREVLRSLLTERFCGVGRQVVIEEGIEGQNATLAVLTDGETLLTLPPARVERRSTDDAAGPLAEGLGAYVPASGLDDHAYGRVEAEILLPTFEGLHAERLAGAGVLEVDLMTTRKGKPYALGYGVGFGDPGTQAILALLASDLYPALSACADGDLDRAQLEWRDGAAVSVVLCVARDPIERIGRHAPIAGLDDVERMPDVIVDHHGTDRRRGQLVTRGGRTLTVTGLGANVEEARELAYAAIQGIEFHGMRYRRDIAQA